MLRIERSDRHNYCCCDVGWMKNQANPLSTNIFMWLIHFF